MSKNFDDYVKELNPEQKEAALHDKGSVMVLAAAGSGKTKTLTTNVSNLILNKGVFPHNILVVTFTNKAAKELKNRLENMGIKTDKLWVGTFHGTCNKILRNHPEQAGLRKNFYIMDQQEQLSFLKRIGRAHDFDPKVYNMSDLQDKINGYKEVGWRSNKLRAGSIEHSVYSLYEQECIKENCVDFAELMLCCMDLFNNHPEIANGYADKFRHILVDEFQDTNEMQYAWLKILASKYRNIFAVGDDDQSIYSFRGAKPENINIFMKEFNAKLIKIEKNYRSDAHVLEAANAVISHNSNRQGKMLVPTKAKKNKLKLYESFNDEQEAQFIAGEIKKLRRSGVHYKNIAILYRSNSQSRSLERAIANQNIPYIIYGGFRFFDRQEVKHAMAYLRLALDETDNMAFLRVANFPARAIGESALKKLDKAAKENNVSLYEMVSLSDDKTKKKFEPFIAVIDKLNALCEGKTLFEQVKTVIIESGLERLYEADKKEGPERLDNLYELLSAAEVFMYENNPANVQEFLAFSTLESNVETKEKNDNADVIKMMTVHASKGLEFDYVFVTGMEEGMFPHANALKDKVAIEEERRLMYVAITRAKTNLYLTQCEERLVHGQRNHFIRSRFLNEIPTELISKAF